MMRYIWILLAMLLVPQVALSEEGDKIKEQHKTAATKLIEMNKKGISLAGRVSQNGSEGTFHAVFWDDQALVTKTFGDLVFTDFSDAEAMWTGSNFDLPYKIEDEDSPFSATLNILNDGTYLDDPYWEHFVYINEDAGGYNFRFEPPGLEPVDVILYSDPAVPEYLQIMSFEFAFSPDDPDSMHHRGYYYYEPDENGDLFISRETGRDIDHNGDYVNFTEFVVEKAEKIDAAPEGFGFDTGRNPVNGIGEGITSSATIPTDLSMGFFVVPVIFEGSDKVHSFIFDSGSSATILTPEAAEDAGFEPSMNITVHGHGTREDVQTGLLTGARIGMPSGEQLPLAGFMATTLPGNSSELLAGLRMRGVSGIMGNSLLHQYVATFDMLNGVMVLTPKQIFDPAADVGRPNIEYWLDVEDLIFFTTSRLNGELSGELVLDTGLQVPLALLRETLDSAGIKLEKIDEQENMVVGGVKSFDYVHVPMFEIGPLAATDLVASVTDDDRGTMSARHVMGFVGMPFFSRGRVTIDLFDQRLYLSMYDENDIEGLPEDAWLFDEMPMEPEADVEAAPDEGPDDNQGETVIDSDDLGDEDNENNNPPVTSI